MKKMIFPWLICLLSACGPVSQKQEPVIVQAPSSLPDTLVTDGKDTVAVKAALSEEEMKDDSVFKDGSVPSSWKNAGISDVKGLKLFLKQVQQWVIANDRQKLAAAVKYPLKNISNEKDLIAAFDTVFTKEVRAAFTMINFNQVFRNQNGVMLDGGKVWISQFGNDFKIFAINP